MSNKIKIFHKEKKILDLVNLSPQMSRELNEIAAFSRKDFNDFIDDICKNNINNTYIRATPLVSRDIFIDDTFIKLCRLKLLIKYLKANRYDLIVVNSMDEKKCFKGVVDSYHKNVDIIIDDCHIEKMGNVFKHIASFLFFIKHEFEIKKYSNAKREIFDIQKTFVFSPVLSTSICNGKYVDRYFTGVQEYSQCPLVFIPNIIMNGGLKRKDLVKALLNDQNYEFLFPETFFSLGSIQMLIKYVKECKKLSQRKYYYDEIDVSDIVKYSLMAGRSKWVSFDGIIYSDFLKKLSIKESNIERFIVWFEGRPIDNMIIDSIKKYFPRAKCVAYVSFPPDENFISVHYTDYQIRTCSSPDVLTIPSSYYSKDFLSYDGKCKVSVVPIMRNKYSLSEEKTKKSEYKKVLLLLSAIRDANKLIIHAINEYSKSKKNLKIYVKNHPVYIDKELSYYFKDKLCFDPKYLNGKISECLSDIDVVVTSSTTSSIEVLFGRTPLVVVVPSGKLSYTGIPDEFNDLYKIVYGLDDFTSAIDYYLFDNPKLDYEKVNTLFEEPTMENMAPLFE